MDGTGEEDEKTPLNPNADTPRLVPVHKRQNKTWWIFHTHKIVRKFVFKHWSNKQRLGDNFSLGISLEVNAKTLLKLFILSKFHSISCHKII